MAAALKAYHVGENYDGDQVIVYATNSATARREGGVELGLSFEDVDFCRRAPHFDQYASQPFIPAQAYHDAGWWLSCWGCETQLYADSEDDGGNARAMVYVGSAVYCSQACRDARQRMIDELDAKGDAFKRKIQAARPDLTFTEWHVGWPHITRLAKFTFPGSKYGGSVRDQDADGKLEWYVANDDKEAWEAYEAGRKQVAAEVADD